MRKVDTNVNEHISVLDVLRGARPMPRICAAFSRNTGQQARAGLLMHTGSTLAWLTPDVCWPHRGGGCCDDR